MAQIEKIMSIYYGSNKLPYKDEDRQTHYPIVGGDLFIGENNVTTLRFYVNEIGGNQFSWVAVLKLPDGSSAYKPLDEVSEDGYVDLDISNIYTSQVGAVFISLRGYTSDDVLITEEDGVWYVHGNPTVLTTGVVKIMVNYAPQVLGMGGELTYNQYQLILALLSTKIGYPTEVVRVNELPEQGLDNYIYVVQENDTLHNVYIWNGKTNEYVFIGSNEIDLGAYYTKEEGETFEEEIGNRVTRVENELSSVASGAPKGVYDDVTALTTAHPTGDDNIYVCLDTGDWYYWDSSTSEWVSGGNYLSTGDAVPNTRTIAGINLENDISKNALKDALEIEPLLADDITTANEIKQDFRKLSVLEEITQGNLSVYAGQNVCVEKYPTQNSGFLVFKVKPALTTDVKVLICSKDSSNIFTIKKVKEFSVIGGTWNELDTKLQVEVGDYVAVAYKENSAYYTLSTSLPQTDDYGVLYGNVTYNNLIENTPFGGLTQSNIVNYMQDYCVSKNYQLKDNGLENQNYGERSISSNKLQEGRTFYTDFKYLKEISGKWEEEDLTNYNTSVLTIRSAPISRNAKALVKIYSRATGVAKIMLGTYESNTFTITFIKNFNLNAGLNTIIIDVENGDYIGVLYPSNCGSYYIDASDLDAYYFKDELTLPSSLNIGTQITITASPTVRFAWDYALVSNESGVSSENIDEKSITYDKLSDEVKALMNFGNFYKKRCNISQILRNPSSTIKIKLIGDSITYGVGATNRETTSWAGLMKTYFESMFNCTVTNNGVSGQDSAYIVNNLSTLISNDDNIVICMIGTNNRVTGANLYNDMITISQYCEERNIKFIPMCSIPANNADETSAYRTYHMDKVNHLLTAFAEDYQYELIDLYTEFYKFCQFNDTTLTSYLSDGLHPNDAGYYVMYRLICDKLGCAPKITGATW